ncbi:arylsulfatase [candidate division KSB1 bacterium]|nr:arylsulfatase [candidate division KSB1 bacterium]
MNTTRRQFIKSTAIGLGALSVPSFFTCSQLNSSRPNIVLMMVDDMGYSDLGCYGSEIHTPNIDQLANEGLKFSQFYNAARCCPTRASLLTGLYPHQAGMGGMVKSPQNSTAGAYQGYLNDQCVTIAEVLKTAGYRTLMSGKWHVGESRPHWPTDRGFDRYFGLISGAANYFDISKTKSPNVVRQMALDDQPFTPPKEGFYMTDAITQHAVDFLDQETGNSNPFFLYVAYTAPHWPLHALPEDIEKYRGKYREGWEVLRNRRYQKMVEMGLINPEWPLSPPDPEAMPWENVPDMELMDLKMAVYAAQIDRMDQGVGKIMNKLREMGQAENTLVLFLSDNGACHESGPLGFDNRKNGLPPGGVDSFMSYGRSWSNASNTPFRLHKHWVHEGGISTPLIAWWPGKIQQPGTITHQPGHIIDIMATCCVVAKAKYPAKIDNKPIIPLEGKSLTSVFKGKTRKLHETIYWEHLGNRAIRQGKWKLVSVNKGQWELYDLEADRTELKDLSTIYPAQLKEMIRIYEKWAQKWGV